MQQAIKWKLMDSLINPSGLPALAAGAAGNLVAHILSRFFGKLNKPLQDFRILLLDIVPFTRITPEVAERLLYGK